MFRAQVFEGFTVFAIFQSEAKVEQIITIAETRIVSCFSLNTIVHF